MMTTPPICGANDRIEKKASAPATRPTLSSCHCLTVSMSTEISAISFSRSSLSFKVFTFPNAN